MRVRTEEKREAIVEEASKAFIELGYERTSMAEISARVGGSKATLYGYFASKEQLFIAVALGAGEKHVRPSFEKLAECVDGDEAGALQRFGEGFLGYIVQPTAVAIQRMVVAEAGHSDIGRMFFEAGPKVAHDIVSEFMRQAMARGRLRQADPTVATDHLLGLLNAELIPRRMLGVPVAATKPGVRKVVERAVGAFMAAYAA